jgi:hypothetical protein
MQNFFHGESLQAPEKIAPSNAGIKHLIGISLWSSIRYNKRNGAEHGPAHEEPDDRAEA